MRTRMLSTLLAVLLLLPLLVPAASAATREELDRPEVFLKQSAPNGTCVLVSTAMMLRRAALLQGEEDWRSIDIDTVRAELPGMPYRGTCRGLSVRHAWLPGGGKNAAYLEDMLSRHPEGVVLYARCVPHGVLLTDYTDGVFYCYDPAVNKPADRIPVTEAHGTRIDKSCAIWYIESELPPLTEVEEAQPVPEISADIAVARLADGLGVENGEDFQLFGQALARHC